MCVILNALLPPTSKKYRGIAFSGAVVLVGFSVFSSTQRCPSGKGGAGSFGLLPPSLIDANSSGVSLSRKVDEAFFLSPPPPIPSHSLLHGAALRHRVTSPLP